MKKLLLLIFFVSLAMNAQVPNYVPTTGLVGYWPFTGNTNCSNNTALNVSIANSVTPISDRNGTATSAYTFDGSFNNSYMLVPTNTTLNLTNMTLSVWFDSTQVPTQTDNNQGILGRGNSSNEGYGLVYSYLDADNIKYTGFYIRQNTSNFSFVKVPTSSLPTDNVWTHMVGSYDGQIMRLYINGILVNSLNTSTIPTTSGSLYFGKNKYDGVNFQGKIDDIGIWNRPLNQDEITNLFYSNVPATVYYKWVSHPATEKPIYRHIITDVNSFYTVVAHGIRIYKNPFSTSSTNEYWSTQRDIYVNGVLLYIGVEQTCIGCPGNENNPQIVLMNNYVTNGYNDYNVNYQPSFTVTTNVTNNGNVIKQLINDYVRSNPSTHTSFSFFKYTDVIGSIMTSNTPTLDNDTFTPYTNKISVYPNPCSNTLNINTNETIDKLTVVDITGKTVITQIGNLSSINIEKLSNGIYLLTTYVSDIKYQNKFIKN